MSGSTIDRRVAAADWGALRGDLDAQGWAVVPAVLDEVDCDTIADLYSGHDRLFRSRVIMARHGFGSGEYRYFDYPLPLVVEQLRSSFYPHLASIANRWYQRMRKDVRFPATLGEFIERCHEAGQVRPTPLLLQYGPDDYNCLHQDLYGDLVFPLQLTVLLSKPGEAFHGGEFVITEQRPRMQTRAVVVPLDKGDAVVFAVHNRPVTGSRGDFQVKLRHGVSRLRSGRRHTLGIIFHDAT